MLKKLILGINFLLNVFPISESYAKFYLEMSNWNVHAAVGNFFDLGGGAGGGAAGIPRPQAPVPPPLTLNLDMNLLRDVTVGEGESVQPATGTHVFSVLLVSSVFFGFLTLFQGNFFA